MPSSSFRCGQGLSAQNFDEFKERYHSLDLLLIDDVQFFANKDRTQEEFFNAFEALLAKKSHRDDQRHLPQGPDGHP
jgi:chromosomal replication initiation ATPase DnaA